MTTAEAASSIERSLAALRATFRTRFEVAATEQALRDENAKILGNLVRDFDFTQKPRPPLLLPLHPPFS